MGIGADGVRRSIRDVMTKPGHATHELLGREPELARIRECLRSALAGRGGVIVLSGEAGIGKSAVANAAADEAAELGFRTLRGRAWEFGEAPAYFPVASGLRALGVTPPTPVVSQIDAFALWEDVLEALARASLEAPVLWVIEDLHAGDVGTVELVTFLAQPLRALRVVMIATARLGDARLQSAVQKRLARLERDGTAIELPPLADADVAALAQRVAGRALSPGSLTAWMDRTGGNPLFVIECARAVRAGRSLEQALPQTIVQLVCETLGALPAACRELLEHGAVLGRDFTAAMVARAVERLPAVVIDGLAPALRSGLVVETAPGDFRFEHALVQAAIEESMAAAARRARHARAVAVLAEQGDTTAVLSERARHALAASGVLQEGAIATAVQSALTALVAEGAHDRALALFSRWIELGSERPDAATLLRGSELAAAAGSHAESARLASAAARAARDAGDPVTVARAALGLAASARPGTVTSDHVHALEDALAGLGSVKEPKLECLVRARLAAALQPATDWTVPIEMARAALRSARATGDADLLRQVLLFSGSALTTYVDVTETQAIAEELLATSLEARDTALSLRAYVRLIFGDFESGDLAALDSHAGSMLSLAASAGHPSLVWRPLIAASMRALARGQFVESHRFITELQELARISDDPGLSFTLASHSACAILARGDEARSREVIATEGPDIAASAGAFEPMVHAMFAARLEDGSLVERHLPALLTMVRSGPPGSPELGLAGEAIALAGTREEREVVFARLLPAAGRGVHTAPVPCTYEGPVVRVLGLLDASLGRLDAAVTRLEAAREICAAHGLEPWVARTSLELGRVEIAAGRTEPGRAHVREAAALAGRLGMSFVVARAREALGAPRDTADRPIAAEGTGAIQMAREGELWRVSWGNEVARVKDSRGVQLLAKLVGAPGERVHALALAADGESFVPESDAGEALDQKAVAAYRARLSRIDEELAAAEERADAGWVRRHRGERELLVAEIARAVGLGGRLRKAGSATERARVNVTRRLKDAIGRIADASPPIGRHLERVIRTGTYCSYLEKT